jgi:tRNA (mo5U34)-methyltransferase
LVLTQIASLSLYTARPVELASVAPKPASVAEIQRAIEEVPLWYHTLELAPGVLTPGWFDLRPIVDRLPWPDVRGKRCLDVGTYDGFLAFELERRGASEVVATDISDHTQWDWPARDRARGPEYLAALAGPDKGAGFRAAHAALGSRVKRVECSVYDLDPERLGQFDVVVCGSLMLHLRDPLRALEAIRSVCGGSFLSAETVRVSAAMLLSRRRLVDLDGVGDSLHWWVPSPAGHVRMLEASGFAVEHAGPRYSIPFGAAHPASRRVDRLRKATFWRLLGWGPGVAHHAALARPV